jgi:molybdopterin-binding protein
MTMLSARNQLRGTVTSVNTEGLMAEVVLSAGGLEIVSIITKGSAEALGLKEGDQVTAVVKSTEVMIEK